MYESSVAPDTGNLPKAYGPLTVLKHFPKQHYPFEEIGFILKKAVIIERRIKTEEKEKVVAIIGGTHLACCTYYIFSSKVVLHKSLWENILFSRVVVWYMV